MIPGASEHIDNMQRSVAESFRRIGSIDNEMGKTTTTDYDRSMLSKERSVLIKNLEATISDLSEFMTLSQKINESFGGRRGQAGLNQLTQAMPQLLSFATAYANYSRNMNVLSSDRQIAAGIKATAGASEILRNLRIKEGSQNEQNLLKYLTHLGVSQTQRADYINKIAGDSETEKHMFKSFNDMLPKAFRSINTNSKRRTIT